MTEITRRFDHEKRTWKVYTQEEADELGLSYVHWKDAEAGEWSISDDGYVAKVAKIYGPYGDHADRQRSEVVLPYARVWDTKKELLAGEFLESENYGGHNPDSTWDSREVQSGRAQRALGAYARLLVTHGGHIPEPKMKQLGLLYRPDQAIPEASLKRLIRTKAAQKMVAKELAKLLADHNITPDTVIEDYEAAKEGAADEGQYGVVKGIIDRYAKMLEIDEPQNKGRGEKGIEVDWERLMSDDEPEELDGTTAKSLVPAEE